ncbi:transmembrane protein 272-like [Branchiostoma lanceolatum]|uniref:transmembrane protein 272-like n=1 Tax=Branchiostoma lanceolatum TaxID=7740 RepID=UPI003451A433
MATVSDVESGKGGVPLSDLTSPTDVRPKFGGATEYLDDAPPSYASIFEQIKKAREESEGNVEFGKNASTAVAGSKGCTFCTAVLMVVPVAMIAMGALSVYLQDCPIQRMIPIYLLVFGCFALLKSLISLFERCRNHHDNESEKNAKPNPLEGLISCFLFAWFIAGNYWIYSVYTTVNSTDPLDANFCQPILYQFAFWVTTAMYIVVGLFVLVTFCCCCTVCCMISKGSTEKNAMS